MRLRLRMRVDAFVLAGAGSDGPAASWLGSLEGAECDVLIRCERWMIATINDASWRGP